MKKVTILLLSKDNQPKPNQIGSDMKTLTSFFLLFVSVALFLLSFAALLAVPYTNIDGQIAGAVFILSVSAATLILFRAMDRFLEA